MQKMPLGADIRTLFPIFAEHEKNNKSLHYLDSAASSQKPQAVIDRLTRYLSAEHANIHRGAYELSATATANFDNSRLTVAKFLGVPAKNIIFTKGATEGINLVAYSLSDYFNEGDVILLSVLEHHSNIVPWQLLAKRQKLRIVYADCNDDATLNLTDALKKIEDERPKLVAMAELTNSFGVNLPLQKVFEAARAVGALTLTDACQSVVHGTAGITALGCDFYCFSGHKLYGPTGVGICYASDAAYEHMQPFQGGGDMIEQVTLEGSTWAEAPQRFEAGTPAIAEIIAFAEAVKFFVEIENSGVHAHESKLLHTAIETLQTVEGISLYGPAAVSGLGQTSILAFNVHGVHPHDLATICDQYAVQFRAGNHCAMPALRRLGLQSTARISFGVYCDLDDIAALKEAILTAKKMFS